MNLDVTSEEYKLYFEIVMKIADNFEAEEADKIILKLGDLLEKVSRVELPVMQKTAEGLLPCPFCGGEASIGTTRISDPMTAKLNNRTNGFFVNCKICGANNNTLHLGYATKEIAAHYWNTRK